MVCSAEPAVTESKVGRPTVRSDSLANFICELIAEGSSLRSICRDERMPSLSTVCRWLSQDPEFQEQYARSRERQAEVYADEIVDIADEAKTADSAAVARVRVDSRKWVVSKLLPKKYGERNSGDVHVNTTVNNLLVLTDQRQREIQEIRKGLLER